MRRDGADVQKSRNDGSLGHIKATKGRDLQIENFSTERFRIKDWRSLINNDVARKKLEAALTAILSPPVLEHLPPSLQLDSEEGAISSWVDARVAESNVFVVNSKADKQLIGLVILAPEPDHSKRPIIHLGYLIAEPAWGQGAASELVKGLVSALRSLAPARLVGGVDNDNPASARVLQKAGFVQDSALSTPHSEIYTRDID